VGAFFTNYQVRSDSMEDVIRVLNSSVRRRAYISPPKNGWVTVYDESSDDQDERELQRLAKTISKDLSTSAFAFLNHDSDVLLYFLYERGVLADEYNSNPDYFEEADQATRERCRGKAEVVLRHCIDGTTVQDIENILHRADEYTFAENILDDLAPRLDIDPLRLRFGFKYFEDEGDENLGDAEASQLVGKGVRDVERTGGRKPMKQEAVAAGFPVVSPPQSGDFYCIAIGLIISARSHSLVPQGIAGMLGRDSQDIQRQIRKKMDASIKKMLKPCPAPEWPTAEMLLDAADRGPAEMAKLVATATPQMLDQVAVQAAMYDLAWLRAFVEAGGNVNATTERGQTALAACIAQDKEENVAYLLQAGVSPNAKLPDGKTPLELAHFRQHTQIIDLLRKHGAKG